MKLFALALIVFVLAGCSTDAEVASRNLSTAADMFEIDRRIVFYNGINGEYMLEIEGRCSIQNEERGGSGQLSVTCLVAKGQYKKHFLGLSDNVTYFAEQIGMSEQSVYRYRVVFKPSTIIPAIDLRVGQ